MLPQFDTKALPVETTERGKKENTFIVNGIITTEHNLK